MNLVIRTFLAGVLAVSAAGAGNALAAASRADPAVIDGGHMQSPHWRGSNPFSRGAAYPWFGSDPLGLMIDPLATHPTVPYRATPQRPLAATGAAELAFYPNGEGVEVDQPTDIVYSADGQYVLVPAAGKSPLPGTANLSVHDAADMSLVRIIPLTHAPGRMAVMSSQPRAVLLNPTNDTVTVVDYMAGIELAVIPVDGHPSALAISTDDTIAVIQGSGDLELGTSWSVIDLSSNIETSRFTGPSVVGLTTLGNFAHVRYAKMPVFLPGGDKVATPEIQYNVDDGIITLSVAILDIPTLAWTTIPIAASQELTYGSLASTPDGSILAAPYVMVDPVSFMYETRIAVVDSESFAVTDHVIEEAPFPHGVEALVNPSGSKVVVNGMNALEILDTASGTVGAADVADFPYNFDWWAVANLAGGDHFLAWYWGAGDLGYQIFDWNGDRLSELIAPDLTGFFDVFTQYLAVSPINDSHLAFVDPDEVGEDLVLLDLDPSNPQVLVHQQVGNGGIEGDGATKLMVSADQSTALVLNYQSNNAAFVDLATMTNTQWVGTPKYATDAALTPDGDTAIFIAGWPDVFVPPVATGRMVVVDRGTGDTTDIPLPPGSFGRALAIDSSGDYGYTLLATSGVEGTELARVDLATRQLDGARLPIPGGVTYVPSREGFFSDLVSLPVTLNESSTWSAQSHDGNLLAIASNPEEATVTLIDKATWTVVTSIPVPEAYDPIAMMFSSDDSRLYVVGQAALGVIDIDGAESALIWTEPEAVLALERSATLSPDNTKLYVGIWALRPTVSYNLKVFDTVALATAATLTLPIQNDLGLSGGPYTERQLNRPTSFHWAEDGSRLYAFSLNDEVHVIDPSTDEVVDSFTTGFLSPTSVIPLTSTTRGSTEPRFIMASYNSANDGLAVLTIGEGGGDVIFQSGFEQN